MLSLIRLYHTENVLHNARRIYHTQLGILTLFHFPFTRFHNSLPITLIADHADLSLFMAPKQ